MYTKLLLIGALLASTAKLCRNQQKDPTPYLFTKTNKKGISGAEQDSILLSSISATLDYKLLNNRLEKFKLILPFEREIIVERKRYEQTGNSVFWIGNVKDDPQSIVYLTYTGSALNGRINIGKEQYRILYTGLNVYNIARIDPLKSIDDDNDAKQPDQYDSTSNRQTLACSDPKTEIDVLVVYTSDAEKGAGGRDGMESLIAQSVNLTNVSYEISKVDHRIKLVHHDKVAYTESGNTATDVTALQSQTDGKMDDVHLLRNLYKADIVVLIVEKTQGNTAGQAYSILNTLSSSFENKAFCIVKRENSADNLTFAHEIGHLLGGRHFDDTDITPFPYCHGHQDGTYRTIMSKDKSTIRLTYFSNPSVKFPSGSITGVPGISENYKVFNQTAAIVSKFRCRTSSN